MNTSLSNNPSQTPDNTEFSFDLSQLGIFTGDKEKKNDYSSSSEQGDTKKDQILGENAMEEIEKLKVKEHKLPQKSFKQWRKESKLKNKGIRMDRGHDLRTTCEFFGFSI